MERATTAGKSQRSTKEYEYQGYRDATKIAQAGAWGGQNTSGWQQLPPEPDLILAVRLKEAAAICCIRSKPCGHAVEQISLQEDMRLEDPQVRVILGAGLLDVMPCHIATEVTSVHQRSANAWALANLCRRVSSSCDGGGRIDKVKHCETE